MEIKYSVNKIIIQNKVFFSQRKQRWVIKCYQAEINHHKQMQDENG